MLGQGTICIKVYFRQKSRWRQTEGSRNRSRLMTVCSAIGAEANFYEYHESAFVRTRKSDPGNLVSTCGFWLVLWSSASTKVRYRADAGVRNVHCRWQAASDPRAKLVAGELESGCRSVEWTDPQPCAMLTSHKTREPRQQCLLSSLLKRSTTCSTTGNGRFTLQYRFPPYFPLHLQLWRHSIVVALMYWRS